MFETQLAILLALIAGFIVISKNPSKNVRKVKTEKYLSEMIKKKNKTRKLIIILLEFFLLFLAIYFALAMKIFWAVVVSNSMSPTFERGDMVLIQTFDKNPKPGDIVMFIKKDINLPLTHRVLNVKGNLVFTGGDASGPDSSPIHKAEIIGKAVTVFGRPIVIKGVGNYFILDAKQLRDITPYGEEYLFYKEMLETFRQYAVAIIIMAISAYIYLSIRDLRT